MKHYVLPWLILLVLPCLALGADKSEITLYLQLIRGTDSDKPPAADARLAGPELSRRLNMFKWKNYWEINHRTVLLDSGDKTRQRMSDEREVEIVRNAPHEMTVSIYTHGKLTRRRVQSLDTPFYIAGGGDKDSSQSWFIVLRREKPPEWKITLN
jgi:hypothetical protein